MSPGDSKIKKKSLICSFYRYGLSRVARKNIMDEVIFTPRVSDASGVIVLASSFCMYVSLSQLIGQTYGPEFRGGG